MSKAANRTRNANRELSIRFDHKEIIENHNKGSFCVGRGWVSEGSELNREMRLRSGIGELVIS